MREWRDIGIWAARRWHRIRWRLFNSEAVLLLSILGVGCGLLAGAVILLFRFVVETAQAAMLGGDPEQFESLSMLHRFLLPVLGALVIGLYASIVSRRGGWEVGVTHVMRRVAYHQGQLPLREALHQFVTGALSLISGHSVGREGPAIHLGAASGSQLGQRLGLPNNSIRTLVACGTAAAIGASFNTPLAGVAFAMEVVMMEYTIAGFLPVILAAVSATALNQLVYGAAPAFVVPALKLHGLIELPYVLIAGIAMGPLAALFIRLVDLVRRISVNRPIALQMAAGGIGVGACAVFVPEVMGVGYDTVNHALLGLAPVSVLIGVVALKILATSMAIGFRLPGGLIGPTLVIGAAAGGALGTLGAWLTPTVVTTPGLYALLCMGAMMAATLRAPLAALTAMLELTANPNIILPGMLVVVTATLVAGEFFRTESIFLTLLRPAGGAARMRAIREALTQLGIARLMDRRLAVLPCKVERARLDDALLSDPRWLILEPGPGEAPAAIVPAGDVLAFLQLSQEAGEIDLMSIPAKRLQAAPVEMRATLSEALDALRKHEAEALYVVQTTVPGIRRYYGVVTRTDLERHL